MDDSPPAGTRWTNRRRYLLACACLLLLGASRETIWEGAFDRDGAPLPLP